MAGPFIDASVYCFKCKSKIDFKNTSNHTTITRKNKNGMTTTLLCAICDQCKGKVCTILGNQKTKYKKLTIGGKRKSGGAKRKSGGVKRKSGGVKRKSGGKCKRKSGGKCKRKSGGQKGGAETNIKTIGWEDALSAFSAFKF